MGITHSQFVANHILQACQSSVGQEYVSMNDLETPQFLHHLRFLLRDLTALPRLPELETTIKNYFILKPCPSIEAEDTERADALVQSPEVFLSRLPEDDNLARRLFRGSVEGNDQVIKRLCTLLFSWMRTDFNSKFHSKGRGEPLARYLNLDKSKTCSDLAYTGCQLQALYDKSPALLLATIKSSLYDFERHLPKDKLRIEDATRRVASSRNKLETYTHHVKSTLETIKQECTTWLEALEAIGKEQESKEQEGARPSKRKKTERISVLLILPKTVDNEHGEGHRLLPGFPDGQNLIMTQAPDSLLIPGASSIATAPQSASSMAFANTVPVEQPIDHTLPVIGNGPGMTTTDSYGAGVNLAETWTSIGQDLEAGFTSSDLRYYNLFSREQYSNPSAEFCLVSPIFESSTGQTADITVEQGNIWI